jgi:hypothetical protein
VENFIIIKADSSRVWLSRIVQSASGSLLHDFPDSKQETCDRTNDFIAHTQALAVLPSYSPPDFTRGHLAWCLIVYFGVNLLLQRSIGTCS